MADKKITLGEEINTEDQVQADVNSSANEPQFRYVCEACTGIAFYTNSKPLAEFPSGVICRNCGLLLSRIKDENYIPLTESEKESLRVLASSN